MGPTGPHHPQKAEPQSCSPQNRTPSTPWLCFEILSIEVMNRIVDKRQPWQSPTLTGKESNLLLAMRTKLLTPIRGSEQLPVWPASLWTVVCVDQGQSWLLLTEPVPGFALSAASCTTPATGRPARVRHRRDSSRCLAAVSDNPSVVVRINPWAKAQVSNSLPVCFLCCSGSLLQVSTFYSLPHLTTQVVWQFYNMMCLQLGTTAMGRVYILTETETSSGLALSLKTRMCFITLALSLCIVIWWHILK